MDKDYVWGFEYCSSNYDSDFGLISLHGKATSAYKAMRAFRDDIIVEETWNSLKDLGYFLYPHGSRSKGGKPDWSVRIRKIKIFND